MSNQWWEITILCEPSLEELIFARLEKFGCRGTATENKDKSCLIRAYLPQEAAQILDLAALSLWLKQDALALDLTEPMTQWRSIDEEDWATKWKQHWQPTDVGDRFTIYPAWLPVPESSERLILRLDPGIAFGTGMHASTQLCLESLEMRLSIKPENLVLADIGCGSGILSIGSILLGAKQVYAVDTDPLAVKSTESNRELNNIEAERLLVRTGSLEDLWEMIDPGFDGILCNILADVIMELIPQMTTLSKPHAWGILSGLLLDQAKVVTDVLEENGWIVATLWKRQEWCCLNVRKI